MRFTKKRRHAVSPVIAELLLIVITVAIGTLVYSFASTAFGGFGAGFSNLVQAAGNQLSENVAVEQVYFFTNNTQYNGAFQTGDLFIRNTGANTVVITQIYLSNITANTPVSPKDLAFFAWNPAAGKHYNIPLPASTGANGVSCAPSTCIVSLAPGQAVLLRFECLQTSNSVVPGSVYSFTLVTARGNQFLAYEKV